MAAAFLSFDLSTQSLKVIASDDILNVVYEDCIIFDRDLPEFKTTNGIHRDKTGARITSPTLMWVKALDLALMNIQERKILLSNVQAISGSAQQHGSVFWKSSAELTLKHLDQKATLHDQLQECFAIGDSPVWMDSSTSDYCSRLEETVGSCSELARITGSKAYERFTGSQIAKIRHDHPDEYSSCERICLVSNFLSSLFLGQYAPIDFSDASGMNLLNIHSKEWDNRLLDACAPNLARKLGKPVPSNTVLGTVSRYMSYQLGLRADCKVVAFTGDNPSSLAGMRLQEGDVAVSLGTSDTLIFWTTEARPAVEGHVFVNPIDEKDFMAMLCFKNGSLTRQNVCNMQCDGSWPIFNSMLERTPAGNCGTMGIYFDEMEIIPFAKGVCRQTASGAVVDSLPSESEVRAVVEGQCLGKRYHAEKFGFTAAPSSRILATGGASSNSRILQVLSDVFNLPVYALSATANSACLGGIYRARHALVGGGKESFRRIVEHVDPYQAVSQPNSHNHAIYSLMLSRYAELEQLVIEKCSEVAK